MSFAWLIGLLSVGAFSLGYVLGRGRSRLRWHALPLAVALLPALAAVVFVLTEDRPCYEACGSDLFAYAAGTLLAPALLYLAGAWIASEAPPARDAR
jgi:hypothetical protein